MFSARERGWLRFDSPVAVCEARCLNEVMPALHRVSEETARRGRWAAGFIAYEAAPAFDPALVVRPPDPALPLLWFGLYAKPRMIARADIGAEALAGAPDWTATVQDADYARAIGLIKERIRRGDTYQVNYTLRLRAPFTQPASALFASLIDAQETPYGAFVETPEWAVCSASPELFLEWDGERLASKPMKGTLPRGLWPAEDRRLAAALAASEKDRAEHVMIVDMVRNDLGRIAETGSVEVVNPFAIEPYPTLWQMTSLVQCATRADLPDILRALFPAASITGAPKAATMSLIAELETAPRGIYTGALGFVAPGRRAQLNVAIRTARVDKRAGTAEYGTGGGIVWDSTAESELEEARVKARILTRRRPVFSLLETLLWQPEEGCFLLDGHLDRLAESAAFFAFPLDRDDLRRRLMESVRGLPPVPHRIRLVVPKGGIPELTIAPLIPLPTPYRVALAVEPIDASDPFLFHKTTRRNVYEAARKQAGTACDDVLLWNRRGEITESTLANVMVERDGIWYTPPVSCGLLGGVYRARLLEQGLLREGLIRREELVAGSKIRLINSVRKEWDIVYLNPEH
jgi:para-aminobenzoate synthetase/4-amino-4-deoxychorismate lyase